MKHAMIVIVMLVCVAGATYGAYTMTRNLPPPMVVIAAVLAAAWTIADYRRAR